MSLLVNVEDDYLDIDDTSVSSIVTFGLLSGAWRWLAWVYNYGGIGLFNRARNDPGVVSDNYELLNKDLSLIDDISISDIEKTSILEIEVLVAINIVVDSDVDYTLTRRNEALIESVIKIYDELFSSSVEDNCLIG